jgi:hypothetical protein
MNRKLSWKTSSHMCTISSSLNQSHRRNSLLPRKTKPFLRARTLFPYHPLRQQKHRYRNTMDQRVPKSPLFSRQTLLALHHRKTLHPVFLPDLLTAYTPLLATSRQSRFAQMRSLHGCLKARVPLIAFQYRLRLQKSRQTMDLTRSSLTQGRAAGLAVVDKRRNRQCPHRLINTHSLRILPPMQHQCGLLRLHPRYRHSKVKHHPLLQRERIRLIDSISFSSFVSTFCILVSYMFCSCPSFWTCSLFVCYRRMLFVSFRTS